MGAVANSEELGGFRCILPVQSVEEAVCFGSGDGGVRVQSMQQQIDPFQRQFLGQYLAVEARSIAAAAADRLIDRHPALAARFSPMPEAKWRVHLEGWATDLAAAINVGWPDVFTSRLRWCAVAFSAREVPIADLAAAFEAFKHALDRHVPKEDAPLLLPYFDAAETFLRAPNLDKVPEAAAGRLSGLAMAFLVAILEGDRARASGMIMDAVSGGSLPAKSVYTEIVVPVMREVGRLWHLGEMSIAEEHFASATVITVLGRLQAFMPAKPPNGKTLLSASVEGNSHDIGIQILSDVFESEGWRTIYLGGPVPVEDIAAAVVDFSVDLVALSATLSQHLSTLGDAVAAVKSARPENPPRVMVGGAALALAPNAWKELGADAWGKSLEDAVRVAAEMFGLGHDRPSGR
mgnify:CR=1 FL=1